MSERDDLDELGPRARERLHEVDQAAYRAMYCAAAADLGTGTAPVDGALAIWNPRDEDPSFNYLTGFEVAPDPDHAWERGLAAARAGGARVFGVGITEERAAWATPERMARLGLVYDADEIVWAARLDAAAVGSAPTTPGIELLTGGFEAATFARALNRGWEVPEGHGRGRLYAATLGHAGWTHYLAVADGRPAGGGVLFVGEGVAICMVAATDPPFRGRGIQTALIARRLADAVAAGADLAMTETVAGNASPRNFRRAGFRVVARRRIYARPLV
jgi:ribosomal protein S18 acetylase RimI-like enzyme